MLSRERISEHLRLQDQLNQLIHPDWIDQRFNWTRAAMVESAELLDHIGWKWWKDQKTDLEQAQLELVDIWHFILSNELATCHGDHTIAANNLIRSLMDSLSSNVYTGVVGVIDLRTLEARDLVHVFIGMTAFGYVPLAAFDLLLDKLGLRWDELHRMYLAKNVLNIFRQHKGYKTGEYAKVWGKYGEDNKVLAELIKLEPDATAEQLLAELESLYTEVIESAQA